MALIISGFVLFRAWALFNGDGAGTVGSAEFARVLKVSLEL